MVKAFPASGERFKRQPVKELSVARKLPLDEVRVCPS